MLKNENLTAMIIYLNLSNDKVLPNMRPFIFMHAPNIFTDSTINLVNLFITLVCLFIVHISTKIPVSSSIKMHKRVKRIFKRS